MFSTSWFLANDSLEGGLVSRGQVRVLLSDRESIEVSALLDRLSKALQVSRDRLTPETSFSELYSDSLDLVDLVMEFDDEINLGDDGE